MLRAIVIDDEPLALRQMTSYIKRNQELECVGSFADAESATIFMRSEQGEYVDLIFSDINMPGISGIDFIRSIQQSDEVDMPMVIFTTAYSEYAVEGFRLDAVDYLLKPFSYNDFANSVKRASSLAQLRNEYKRAKSSDANAEIESEYISVKADYKVTPVKLSEIIYLESVGEYLRMHLNTGRSITTLFRLKNMEAQLPNSHFIRIHRSYIVNIDSIMSYDRNRVYISDNDYLPIGHNYREAFVAAIGNRTNRD